MVDVAIKDIFRLTAFWLAFTRWLIVLNMLPIFDNVSIPHIMKVLFSLIIAFAFFPAVESFIRGDMQVVGENHFWILTIVYTIISLVLGYMIRIIFQTVVSVGHLISQNLGLSAISYFDPSLEQVSGPIEKMVYWNLILLILGSGALLPMFKGIFISFETLSLARLPNFVASPVELLSFLKAIFLSSLLLATPVIITNFMVTVVLGIIARSIPQMNILMVSLIVNIGVGMFVFILISNEFYVVAFDLYKQFLGKWFQFLQ